MSNFRALVVWRRAFALTLKLYQATEQFPSNERFGLTSQLRRASVSVPSNIAEGSRRIGNRELIRFLSIARGSVGEIECQIQLARDLGYLKFTAWSPLDQEAQEISRMLNALIVALRSPTPAPDGATRTPNSKLPAPNS